MEKCEPALAACTPLMEHVYMGGHGKVSLGRQGMEVADVDLGVSEGKGYRIMFRNRSWPTWML